MSPADELMPQARFGWIRPGWFLAGLGLGLGGMAWLGYATSRTDYHPGYIRIHQSISPETSYYPTLEEMKAIVRGRCRPGQILVIVGGNSILQGVWQPPGEVWSQRLQALLGERYCVVNFAFRGASPTNGGAVVAEALRGEFPHQIYIANEAPLTDVDPTGVEAYRYIFWQGYFTGQLLPSVGRERRVKELKADPVAGRAVREMRIGIGFDRLLHDLDWWNRVACDWFCTVPSIYGSALPDLLKPRLSIPDQEPDATDPVWLARRYPAETLAAEMAVEHGADGVYLERGPDGHWRIPPEVRQGHLDYAEQAFPEPLKTRTLLLFGYDSPHYRRRLTADQAEKEVQAHADTLGIWRGAGYSAIAYGRDFTEDDYGDRIHLSKLGGDKLAAAVAPEVRRIAQGLGYAP